GDHKVRTHQKIRLKVPGSRTIITEKETVEIKNTIITTTVGRVIFDDILPKGMPYYNPALKKKNIPRVIPDCHKLLGKQATIAILDDLKELGFKASTLAGLSFGKNDMRM